MKYIALFLLLTSCASIKDQYLKGVDKVSCQIECRNQGKMVDATQPTCFCIFEKKDTFKTILQKLEILEKKMEEQKPPVCPNDLSSREIHPPPPSPKKPSGDPLLDILNE